VEKTFLLAALSAVLAAVMVTPALAQLSGEGPPPPEYQVKDDGTLVIGGDVVVSCSQIGREDPYLMPGGPEARACEAAGFGTADDPFLGDTQADGDTSSSSGVSADARPLPETGGFALPGLLLAAGVSLTAGCLLAWRTTRRTRRAP
jgi:hypothetical protein